MKKLLLIILFSFLNHLIYGQNLIDRIWISDQLEYLSIKDSTLFLEDNGKLEKFNLLRKDSILEFEQFYFTFNDKKEYTRYIYKVNLKSDSLFLSDKKVTGRDIFRPKKEYRLIDKNSIKSDNFNFQSIAFKVTFCSGRCSNTIKIDSIGNLFYRGENNRKNIIGNFEGKLNESQLKELINILCKSEIDKFPRILGYADDVPIYYLTFKYNDKIKKSSGYDVPYLTKPLLTYLFDIYTKVTLKRVNYEINYND